MRQQKTHNLDIAVRSGQMQGRVAHLVLSVRIRSGVEQQLRRAACEIPGRLNERGSPPPETNATGPGSVVAASFGSAPADNRSHTVSGLPGIDDAAMRAVRPRPDRAFTSAPCSISFETARRSACSAASVRAGTPSSLRAFGFAPRLIRETAVHESPRYSDSRSEESRFMSIRAAHPAAEAAASSARACVRRCCAQFMSMFLYRECVELDEIRSSQSKECRRRPAA